MARSKKRTIDIHIVDRQIYRRAVQSSEKDAGKVDPALEIRQGWEPFTVTQGDGVDVVWIRRIVKREVTDG